MPRQPEYVRAVSLKTAARFDRFYKLLACAALIFAFAPLVYTFIRPVAGDFTLPIVAGIAPALFIIGYGLQAIFGAVTRMERTLYSRTYEKLESYFTPAKAALPLTLCVIAGFAASSAFSRFYKSGALGFYERASALPLFVGILTVLFLAAGVIAWFYPPGYIVSLHTAFVYLVIFLSDYGLNIVFQVSQKFLAACFAGFLLCAIVVANQTHIVTVINTAGTGIVTPRVRYYNLISVGLLALFAVLTVPVVLAVFIGLAVLVKMLLFFILRERYISPEEQMLMDAGEQAAVFGKTVYGFEEINQSLAKLLFLVFIFIAIGTMAFFIISRYRNILQTIINFIDALFANLLEFLANLFEFNKFSTEKFILSDYRDVETKIDKSAVREYTGKKPQQTARSYRDFLRKLESIADSRERLAFAYAELVRCWDKKYGIRLKSSDTPAEIERKILEVSADTAAEPITRAFEYVKYAERYLPESESAKLIDAMCAQIKRAYGD